MNYLIVYSLEKEKCYQVKPVTVKSHIRQAIKEIKNTEGKNLSYYYICTIEDMKLNKRYYPSLGHFTT